MRTDPPPQKARHHLRATDLRAVALLATQATQAITDIAEGVHQSVWRTLGGHGGVNPAQTQGLTGLVYRGIGVITQRVGQGVAATLDRLEPLLQQLESQGEASPEREAFLAALNGVMGDRLLASANPLATPMTLRLQGQVLNGSVPKAAQVSSKVLIVVHGLCMNELQWASQHAGESVNHATALNVALGYTPVYVRYNSGLHVSENGQALAQQLEALLLHWPVPLTEMTVLAHSMGGLVIRSAVHWACVNGLKWPMLLKNIVFLGTPHHGAPMERAGNWVDVVLGSTSYSRPFAKLGQLRSAGVTDLRYGLVLDSDWQGHERFRQQPDGRTPVPLPAGVNCYVVAATLAAKRGRLSDRLLGDGLVPLYSALGQHPDALRCLKFPASHQYLAYRTGHLQLLSNPAITRQVLVWLG